jgi:hypothetical protein
MYFHLRMLQERGEICWRARLPADQHADRHSFH